LTPLKPIFHREIPAPGNSETLNVARYLSGRIEENKVIKSAITAIYKQVIGFGKDGNGDINMYSSETG